MCIRDRNDFVIDKINFGISSINIFFRRFNNIIVTSKLKVSSDCTNEVTNVSAALVVAYRDAKTWIDLLSNYTIYSTL